MLHEQELLDMAGTYRGMAKRALALRLRFEFDEPAERDATVAAMAKQRREPSTPPKREE